MAAAPHLSFDEPDAVSPELALVDPALAARLRSTLDIPAEVVALPERERHLELLPAVDDTDDADDLIVAPADEVRKPVVVPTVATVSDEGVDDLIVAPDVAPRVDADELSAPSRAVADGPVDESDETRSESSHYPDLPAPDPQATDETDEALRRIREQLASSSSAPRPRVRRRFTVASGLSAVCALTVLAVNVQLGLMRLPNIPLP
jgi:hypothetical protein